jgi:unsaturated rhamnogalacturonyl hydrolase
MKHSSFLSSLALVSGFFCAISGHVSAASTSTGWSQMDAILARIKAPDFPARNFLITDYGAIAGGQDDCSTALRKAIETCHTAGGGHVVVPSGEFLTGAVVLLSNVDLHLEAGAILRFKTDPDAYLPVVFNRWEGIECMNYAPFIYALDQENIGITGQGTLDGSSSEENWWSWKRKDPQGRPRSGADAKILVDMGERNVPVEQRVFGAGHFLRPNFIEPYRCKNVLIEGVSIKRSPMWEINPVLCTNVIVRKVKIDSKGPNNDGCDPESCRDVLIEDCSFITGDDCIAIKSGRNADGRRVGVPVENVIVRRCEMQDGHAGVSLGSEISGDCRNIFIEDCRMNSPALDRAMRLKSNATRGGIIENIWMRRIEVGRVAEAILTIDLLYEEGPKGSFPPIVRNVHLENIPSSSTPRVIWAAGFPAATIDEIYFENCVFKGVESTEVVNGVDSIHFKRVVIEPAKPTAHSTRRVVE